MARGMTSSSSIFYAKGDPWVTEKERRHEYGDASGDPDTDQYLKAKKQTKQSRIITKGFAKQDTQRSKRDPQAMALLNARLVLKRKLAGK